MRVLLLADARSPITRHWIDSLSRSDIEVILVSSYPCANPPKTKDYFCLPLAFARFGGNQAAGQRKDTNQNDNRRTLIKRFRSFFMKMRYILGPLSLPFYAIRLRRLVKMTHPDLVHALRIPFEGMTASWLPHDVPLTVSIWGNDLTLHAKGSYIMKRATLRTLRRTNGLVADTQRDIRLAHLWGLSQDAYSLVVPGNGGIAFTELRLAALKSCDILARLPQGNKRLVINPRGFRPGSVRNDVFFQSIPLILSRCPDAFFICCAMEGQPEALEWIEQLQIERAVMLLPTIDQQNLWALFANANVSVSVSEHDGTPNSLLEAMTCGCFPVVGDIEPMREWITPGVNGLLVDPTSPEQLAAAVVNALQNQALRVEASRINAEIIRNRAEVSVVNTAINVYYQQLSK